MKRQRGVKVNAVNPIIPMENPPPPPPLSPKVEAEVAAAMGKKKPKKETEQAVVVEEEEKKENSDFQDAGVMMQGEEEENGGAVINGWNNWEENMPLFGGVVDETMSWGYTCFPGWDMDLMDNYSDVVLDDDIWNLKNQIPFPVDM